MPGRMRAAIMDAAIGSRVAMALGHGVAEVHAVALNPQLEEIAGNELSAFTGSFFDDARITFHSLDPRAFLSHHHRKLDLIELPTAVEPIRLPGATRGDLPVGKRLFAVGTRPPTVDHITWSDQ